MPTPTGPRPAEAEAEQPVAAAVSAGRRTGALIQGSPSRTFPARNRHFDQRAGWGGGRGTSPGRGPARRGAPSCPQDLSPAGGDRPRSSPAVRQARPMRRPTDLPPDVRHLLAVGDDLVRRRDLLALGVPRSTLTRLVRQESLVSLANGVYTDPATVAALGPWPLLRLRTRALLMVSPPNTYAADW